MATSSITASSGIKIHGTFDWEVPELPSKLPEVEDRSPNMKSYDTWASSTVSQKGDREILTSIKSNLKHVSYDTFHTNVGICVQQFRSKEPGHYIAFVEPGKSQTWVTAIAMEYGLRPDMLLRIGEEGANMLPSTLDEIGKENFPKDVRDIVIVDDGAFTGNQMAFNISSANRILTEAFGSRPGPFHFHVIVPYSTAVADANIQSASKSGAKVHLYTLRAKMPVISDVIPSSKRARASQLLGFMPSRVDSTALTFFDHKIPNSMSFPKGLETAGFIPNQEPPYKKPPFVLEEY